MNKKCLLLVSASLLSLLAISNAPSIKFTKANDDTKLVGEVSSYEDMIEVAANELKLNVDLDHVVTTLNIPLTGLYGSSITWESSNAEVLVVDEENKQVKVVRPTDNDVKVNLTAKLLIRDNKNQAYTKDKVFELTVLKKKTSSETISTTKTITEDFTSYDVGDDLAEYLSWNITSGESGASIVNSVPNNNLQTNMNAIKIDSKKTAQTTQYVRDFYLEGNAVFEGYMMYVGGINGVSFEIGRNDVYGPTIGIKDGKYVYYNNGEKTVADTVAKPVEGVWTKFRIEVNANLRSYKAFVYKMDGSNELVALTGKSAIAYSGKDKFVSQLRIKTVGGTKVGSVYATDLKILPQDQLAASEGANPNRTLGIGNIDGYKDSVLYINGTTKDFEDGFRVYNRFNEAQLYTEGVDYTISKEVLSSTDKIDTNKYTITLAATGEVKELTQTVYKEDANGVPSIDKFKGSHLARKVINESTGELSSLASITVSGLVTRADSTIHYALLDATSTAPTKEEIIAGTRTDFVKKGSFEQTAREVNFSIDELTLDKEYSVYVVISNANGSSEIYSKTNISEVINITTCEEFYEMTVNIDTYRNEFRLLNDLDFSNYTWECLESNNLKFQGTLDGNGHTIRNLSIQSPFRKAAIFFEITNATIKNLNFVDTDISGSQDSAVICGYSNGGHIENISFKNTYVHYNGVAGGEGYFAIVAGRLHKDTTVMKNISIDKASIISNKYSGVLTGNINKDNNCVLNATNIYCDCDIKCDGAAIGLVGRNRGTFNLDNAVVFINIKFAKKEMGAIAGHNKEGGKLNVKNVIGTLNVSDCTQPTYFNYFIGSQDDNTSSYTYENVYFLKADYSLIGDNIVPTTTARTCGVTLEVPDDVDARWYEEYTFISSFASDSVWSYDETLNRPVLVLNKEVNVTADDVNAIIALIKNDLSDDDHYYIHKALYMYEKLSAEEKVKVNKTALDAAKAKWDELLNKVDSIIGQM